MIKGLNASGVTIRLVFLTIAIIMAVMVRTSWSGVVALGILSAAVILGQFGQIVKLQALARSAPWVAAIASVSFLISLTAGSKRVFIFNGFFSVQAWLLAAALWGEESGFRRPFLDDSAGAKLSPSFWKILAVSWAFFGGLVLVCASYLENSIASFYEGLTIVLALLVLTKRGLRLPGFAVQAFNTLILVIIGLPIADSISRPRYNIQSHPDELKRYYSYSVSRKNPEAFARWAKYSGSEWARFERAAIIREPTNCPPFRLRPGARAKLFQSECVINSLGMRGREVASEKGTAYRIVAIGESTTFGITLTDDHQPWPELLERLIKEHFHGRQPVEVLNAGVPGATLPENICRFGREILGLKPDMVISYHGYNGFRLINPAIPHARGKAAPVYIPRPVKLLADFEYARKLGAYKQKMVGQLFSQPPRSISPLETSYAAAYSRLIELARTNHVRLVIANFSMAVNLQSDPAVIEFYRQGWPAVQSQISANTVHSELVQELCAREPWICFADTHPDLDGQHEKFIDLVHFDKSGEQQMAQTIFSAIEPILEKDLILGKP